MRVAPYPKDHRVNTSFHCGYIDITVSTLFDQGIQQLGDIVLVPLISGVNRFAVKRTGLGLPPVGMPDHYEVTMFTRKTYIVLKCFEQFLTGGDIFAGQDFVPALFENALLMI